MKKEICKEDMKLYNTNRVGAYNMSFDKKALNNLVRYTSKSWLRWFFPYGTEFFCIWNFACSVLLNTKSYIDFAIENNLISEADNILTSAECAYKFITKDTEFREEHKGLEDVNIERQIMAYCFSKHKPMAKGLYEKSKRGAKFRASQAARAQL